jgi:hypothetical protein
MTGQILPFRPASPSRHRLRRAPAQPDGRDDAAAAGSADSAAGPGRPAVPSSVTRLWPRPAAKQSTRDLPPCA